MTGEKHRGWAAAGLAAVLLGSPATGRCADPPGEDHLPMVAQARDAHAAGVGRRVGDLAGTDAAGAAWSLKGSLGERATVIALTSGSCPTARKYTPTLARIEKQFASRGVGFAFVISGEAERAEKVALQAKEFAGRTVADRDGRIAAALGARTTAEVFVLDAARTLIYRGAIDDQYGIGAALPAPRRTHLIDAIEAALAGGRPPVGATTAPGCLLEPPAREVGAGETMLTYHADISRIVQSHCVSCHRAGGVGPFALDSYAAVAGRARMIRAVVEGGLMPPWFAAPPEEGRPSPWRNDRSLPAADKEDLLAWLASSRPEGDPAHAPLPTSFDPEWAMGPPDLVVQIPKPIRVKAEGVMPYQHVRIVPALAGDRWVRGFEVLPTAREVVHHVLVFVLPPARPGEPLVDRLRDAVDETRGFFAAYVPGNGAVMFPDGFAKPLLEGSTLVFQMHYTPNGAATEDQTRLGLYFTSEAPRHVIRTAGIASRSLRIPPGAPNHEIHARIPVPADVRVLAFMPHMHVRGKSFRYEAILPDGERRLLLDVPNYDFNWQLRYEYREPLELLKGTTIRTTAHFDNSEGNPNNPDPTATVRWGPQTYDEMMLGYLEYYLVDEAAGATLNPLGPGDGQGTQGDESGPPPREFSGERGRRLVKALDRNGDGKIQRGECPARLIHIFERLDKNHDDELSADELP